ncbi:MAG TPA: NfeD family protein [bacterium]|nr:NfeD family protein [bacterium]HQG45965.1 NfeD family protein [bacterium]HQI48270.1 NfeD family protein [bacterium]HQJ66002.1 NfeD family protein [bacterium]
MYGIDSAVVAWFLIGFFLILTELALPGFIVIFFGVGAWVTCLLLEIGLIRSFNAQLIVFLLASVASLVLFRKKGKAIFEGKKSGKLGPYESLDDFIGQGAEVAQTIEPGQPGGKVEFHGTLWNAESDQHLAPGEKVIILKRDNLTLVVQAQKK